MIELTTPVGRLVGGSPYQGDTKDFDGNPLPDGRVSYTLMIAIPKGSEQAWTQTEWGAAIYNQAVADFDDQTVQRPDFAWKIIDGDSGVPNKRNKIPNQREGFPGHWVMTFRTDFKVGIFSMLSGQLIEVLEDAAVQKGYFVQIQGKVKGNGNQNNPGVYLNPSNLCLIAYGDVIKGESQQDANSAGFGGGALPPGASTAPPAGMVPQAVPVATTTPVATTVPAPVATTTPVATTVPAPVATVAPQHHAAMVPPPPAPQ